MIRMIKSIGAIAAVGLLLIGINAGGVSGCGSGESEPTASEGGTEAQNAQALYTFNGTIEVGGQVNVQLLALGAALQLANKDQTTQPCAVSGSYDVAVSATELTLTFDNCDFGCEVANGPLVFDLATGTSTFPSLTVTPDSGETITLGGSSQFDASTSNFVFDITGTSASDTSGVSGTLVVDQTAGNVTGTLTLSSGDTTLASCSLTDFSVFGASADILSNFAAACGLTAPSCS